MGLTVKDTSASSQPPWAVQLVILLKKIIFSYRWLAFLLIVAAWQLVVANMATGFFPGPIRVATTMWDLVISGLFFKHLAASIVRILVGFAIAMLLGTIIGVLTGSWRFWNEFFQDLVVLGLSLPGLIYALLSVMIFGLSGIAPIVAISAATSPFVAVNIREGVKSLDKDILDMCRAYRVERWSVVRKVILPSLLPFFLAAFRVGLTVAWKVSVLTEVFGGSSGIGYMIRNSFDSFSMRGLIGWGLLFGCVMLTIEYVILLPAERRFARWRPKVEKVI